MSSTPLLALLGVTFLLPCMHALDCQWAAIETVLNTTQMPVEWTNGKKTCDFGDGCQDTLMLIENGPQVNLVLTKGCTSEEDHEVRVTEHRTGPGLSVISYTHVCRHRDLCNDLSSSVPLWSLHTEKGVGGVGSSGGGEGRGCLELWTCPEGFWTWMAAHLTWVEQSWGRGGHAERKTRMASWWWYQRGLPQREVMMMMMIMSLTLGVAAKKGDNQAKDTLTCNRGVMLQMGRKLAQDPVEWTSSTNQMCNPEEVCQETLMLIDVGHRSLLMGSKGCSKAGAQNSQAVSLHSRPPGVLVASYVRVCSSDLCNNAGSSSVLLTSLPKPAAPAPGGLQCPACVQFLGSCSQSSDLVTCPSGVTHCYDGNIAVNGGGLTATLSIQGCMAPASKYLLNHTQNVGIFSVRENFEDENKEQTRTSPSGVARATHLLWVMGMGLFLALWNGGLYPLC
uniref:CD177 antigen n=1 Tax=Ictidomys tridecemlineatus TaxID=43179 RepID=UPI001A9CD3F2|nr:CD177 antigen [Ictidomys tridecemlineatus]